ncbi:MAG: hypothetical protein A2503_02875 [Burkholderiales bacterium RIFOXYD12_FULL_59_19]|nr:MAG: hypothetical protein A2503_02875 [Burkholderiales bacterium RIFOXYD12_FULL_59_19]
MKTLTRRAMKRRSPRVAGVLSLPVAPMPAQKTANPVQVNLLGFEAIVLASKYLAHLIKQAF